MATVTISGNTYNVYLTDTDATVYLLGDVLRSGTWAALTSDEKKRALISATRFLDRQRWRGAKVSDAQALQFPRSGLTRADGTAVDESDYPQEVKDATAILAADLAADPSLINLINSGSNIRRLQAGSAGIEYFKPTIDDATKLPTSISDMLSFFLQGSNLSSGEVFGTDYYDNPDNNASIISKRTLDRNRGY